MTGDGVGTAVFVGTGLAVGTDVAVADCVVGVDKRGTEQDMPKRLMRSKSAKPTTKNLVLDIFLDHLVILCIVIVLSMTSDIICRESCLSDSSDAIGPRIRWLKALLHRFEGPRAQPERQIG